MRNVEPGTLKKYKHKFKMKQSSAYQYNYSVIIPHKNSPDLLKRCLASVPRRKDIQIIVVDDNSDLTEKEFDSFPGIRDPFVEIIFTKEGNGAGFARNTGLQKAKGKWIVFADADDFFNEHAFNWFDEYQCSNYDIVFWNVNSVYSDTLEPSNRSVVTNSFITGYKEGDGGDGLRYSYHTPWCKMIKTSLIVENSIKFDEVPAANDLMFSVRVGHLAKKITADEKRAYCVTVSRGSIVNKINRNNERSRFCTYVRFNNFIEKINKANLRIRLISSFLKSFRFGLAESLYYVEYAKKYNVSIFKGALLFVLGGLGKMFRRREDKKYKIVG